MNGAMKQGFVNCPNCSTVISINDVSALTVGVKSKSKPGRRSGYSRKVRELTDRDRSIILKHNATGWARVSKAQIGSRLNVSPQQINAVCAWIRPTLGGKRYERKYVR